MRGTGAADSRTTDRTLSPRRASTRFQPYEEVTQERGDSPKTAGAKRPSSALQSTGKRLIYDEPVTITQAELRVAPPKTTASRESPTRASGRLQVSTAALTEEFSAKSSSPATLTRQFSAHIQTEDIESSTTKEELLNLSPRRSGRRASVDTRLQIQEDDTTAITQEPLIVSPNKLRPPSPVRQLSDLVQEQNGTPASALDTPPIVHVSQKDSAMPIKLEPLPKVIKPLPPTRQLSERLKLHDGAKKSVSAGASEEPTPAKEVKSILERQRDEARQSQSSHEAQPKIASTTEEASQPCFVPLHTQWAYGQNVFGRYKKTPYFYSGNIATYLGAGLFMVVFDDGTLDYRVRREDIMLREYPASIQPQQQRHRHRRERGRRASENNVASELLHLDSFEAAEIKALLTSSSADTTERRGTQPITTLGDRLSDSNIPGLAPELCLLPSHHVVVDFSVSPPREIVMNFDNSAGEYVTACGRCCDLGDVNQTWQSLLEDETLTMKRLECGVGYEDDSTQVSDSDESSEEDMSMTPWQQMTQTFGMGKAAAARSGQRRRSSVSSVSQIDRSSLKQRKPSITAPKSLKQIITDYFLRGNKKVQPSSTSEMALAEHIRLMDAKLSSIRSALCKNGGFGPLSSTSSAHDAPNSVKVVYERAPNGVRAYGTVIECLDDGGYAVVTEDEQGISVQAVPEGKVDFLPSARELEQQLSDLERSQRVLFAGQKVHVSLYPGSRFSGPGLITLERDPGSRFHVLLANRIRLVNVPADKITPVCEKKKVAVTITEDQFLVCSNKVKVYIGDQIYVKCATGDDGDLDGSVEEEKLGLLNGVYSNRTAAVDFADGSTGYEVPPHLIFKRKRLHVPVDQDVRSLKNAVLMQASAAANGSAGGNALVLEEGYQVKADHPSKASVESCVVIKTHRSTACDLRFSDGTIAFEVFPSQMIIDSVGMKPKTAAMKERFKRAHPPPEYAVGDYVLAWSSRFGRYCSAKINAKASQDRSTTDSESLTSPTENSTIETTLYTLVFDYGEKKADVPADKITTLDDTKALTHTQRLTNFSIDTMGFELSPVIFFAGEAVMARVHGSARYYNGSVESVNEKERHCVVCFDSSERDTDVPFSAIFSVDSRSSFSARTTAGSTMQFSGGGNSSSSEATSRSRFLLRHRNTDETTDSEVLASPRRHSGSGSVRNILKLVAENFLRSSRLKPNPEARRGSHVITEIGARRLRLPDQK